MTKAQYLVFEQELKNIKVVEQTLSLEAMLEKSINDAESGLMLPMEEVFKLFDGTDRV